MKNGKSCCPDNKASMLAEESLLRDKIALLKSQINQLEQEASVRLSVAALTTKTMASAAMIVKAAEPWAGSCGVYFLVKDGEVVYVGQSKNCHGRIGQHPDKDFDSYAFYPCSKDELDIFESAYIHYLQPRLNGCLNNGSKSAPISFHKLIRMAVDHHV